MIGALAISAGHSGVRSARICPACRSAKCLFNPFHAAQRRACIKTGVGNHSFWATAITQCLKNGGRREIAQLMAAHEMYVHHRAILAFTFFLAVRFACVVLGDLPRSAVMRATAAANSAFSAAVERRWEMRRLTRSTGRSDPGRRSRTTRSPCARSPIDNTR